MADFVKNIREKTPFAAAITLQKNIKSAEGFPLRFILDFLQLHSAVYHRLDVAVAAENH